VGNDSISKTFGVALALCVVCAVVVSSAAVILRPTQEVNKLLDLKPIFLPLLGLLKREYRLRLSLSRSALVWSICRLVSLPMRWMPATYDQRKASKDPALSMAWIPSRILPRSSAAPIMPLCIWLKASRALRKLSCPSKAMASGRLCMGFWHWKLILRLLPVLVLRAYRNARSGWRSR